MIVKCTVCGKEFECSPSRYRLGYGRFCSHSCSRKTRTGDRSSNWKGGDIRARCRECGVDVVKERREFLKEKGNFCSRRCQGEWMSKNYTLSNNPCWRGGKDTKICGTCGESFSIDKAWVKRGGGKFCSKKCAGIWRSNNLINKNACNWRGGVNPLNMAIRTSKEYCEWRWGVFSRDKFTCIVCGTKKSGSFEAHHINPFSKIVSEMAVSNTALDLIRFAKTYSPLWDISNGITLCCDCHIEEHKKGGK